MDIIVPIGFVAVIVINLFGIISGGGSVAHMADFASLIVTGLGGTTSLLVANDFGTILGVPKAVGVLLNKPKFDWKVTVADTGYHTQTGGRVLRIKDYIGNEPFLLTYGDAVGNVDINAVIESHKKSGKLATISVYNFGQSKGVVEIDKNGIVKAFREKSDIDGDLINIGFMVFEPQVFDMIEGNKSILEKDVLQKLAEQGQLNSYRHKGFWQCMDTLREKEKLEELEDKGDAPWKVWRN